MIQKPPIDKSMKVYPTIQTLIDTEDFSKFNQTMTACYESLERMLQEKKGGLNRQKKIRQALQAYDLTIDLVKYLLKLKYDMTQERMKAQEKK